VGEHGEPSEQAPHCPLLQTFPAPHVVPLAIGLHVPVVQELQVPQAVWQQIPETQWPFWHWLSTVQALPSAICGLHAPAEQ